MSQSLPPQAGPLQEHQPCLSDSSSCNVGQEPSVLGAVLGAGATVVAKGSLYSSGAQRITRHIYKRTN